jgi:uncharacterized membrane protein (DUF373 family)
VSLLDQLDKAIVIGSMACELAVLTLVLRRKVWKQLPFFSMYIAWSLVSDVSGYLILTSFPARYENFFVIESTVDSLLQFTVLVELIWSVLKPVRNSLPKSTVWILTGLVAVAGALVWPLAANAVSPHLDAAARVISQVIETFAILRVAFFLVMASLSQLLSIGWRDRELQVATGLGAYSIVSLLVAMLHSHQNVGAAYHKLDMVPAAVYVASLSYWVWSFSTKEQERKEFTPQMRQILLSMSGGARTGRLSVNDLPPERPRKKE